MMKQRHISVGRRLMGLVAIEIACGGSLLALLVWWAAETEQDLLFMGRFALDPIESISTALERAASLEAMFETRAPDAQSRIRLLTTDLERFTTRYQSEWQVALNRSTDAVKFRRMLLAAGQGQAIEDERRAISDVRRLLGQLRGARPTDSPETAEQLRNALRALLVVNVAFMQTALDDVARSTARAGDVLLVVGLLVGVLVTTLGIMVHRAIAPRLRRLVKKVEKFREYGAFEREPLEGSDEIAVLGHAIDVGFEAITTRERERERFLAIAAHELKTPLTSILGFSQAALENRGGVDLRGRALDVIRRHASRLGRVIDDLLLAAAARSGTLSFSPGRSVGADAPGAGRGRGIAAPARIRAATRRARARARRRSVAGAEPVDLVHLRGGGLAPGRADPRRGGLCIAAVPRRSGDRGAVDRAP
jgi:signal transduction histidine kinase